jgi:pimeloyl-ACP methyl ester carboxylesterase
MKLPKFLRRMLYFLLFLMLIWIVCVQAGCLAMRTPDRKWPEKMHQKGQPLAPIFTDVPNAQQRNLHAVSLPARDSLPWIILAHGSPGSADAYLDYLSDTVLSKHANLVSVDRAGFGYSDFGRPEISLPAQAANLKTVMDRLAPGRKWLLAGHSLGGPLVARFAMDYPENTAGIVIIAGSVDPALEPQQWWVSWVDNPPLKWLIPKSLWASNHEIRYLKKELENMLPLWENIHCPVHIIHAENDRLVPFGNVAFLQQKLAHNPQVTYTIYKEGDHFILWSQQAQIRDVLIEMCR